MQNLLSSPSTYDCCKIIKKKTTLTLSTKEFIRRIQLHILSKGFTRKRHNGFLSSS
nr:transposase [Psychroflexus sp. MES1-P1E]